MTSSKRPAARPSWSSDPLLGRQPTKPVLAFVRSSWDENHAENFGPWRISPKPDPAESQSTPAPLPAERVPPSSVAKAADVAAQAPSVERSSTEHKGPPPATPPRTPPRPEPDPAMLKALEQAAYKKGLSEGRQLEQQAMQSQREQERELIRNLGIELRGLQQDPDRFFEPLKKLAMHLAETLVRTELQTSEKAINALIEACVAQLQPNGEVVSVSLSPSDMQRIGTLGETPDPNIKWQVDDKLRPGSVRAQVQDALVQDLIEHRLEALARKVLAQPEAWMARSSLLRDGIDVQAVDTPEASWPSQAGDIIDADEPRDPEEPV